MGLNHSSNIDPPDDDKIIICNQNNFSIIVLKIALIVNLDENVDYKKIIKIGPNRKLSVKINRKNVEFIYIYNFSFINNMNLPEDEFIKYNIASEDPIMKIKNCFMLKSGTVFNIINNN